MRLGHFIRYHVTVEVHCRAKGTSRAVYTYTGGNWIESIAHAPFGETYVGKPQNFTGQWSDGDTGNTTYYFPARQYRSSQGRWLSPDPAGVQAADPSNPQSWNRYAYVLNNPLRSIDPQGLDCIYLADDNSVNNVLPGDCKSETDEGIYVDGTIVGGANGINNSNYGTAGPYGTLNFYVQGQTDPTSVCVAADCGGNVGSVNGDPNASLPTSGSVVIGASFDQAVSVLGQAGIVPSPLDNKYHTHNGQFNLRDFKPLCSVHVTLDPASGQNGQPTTGSFHLDLFNPTASTPPSPAVMLTLHGVYDVVPDRTFDLTGTYIFPPGRSACGGQ